MVKAADQDMLLPILNRRAFVRELSRFIGFAERYGTPASVVYFDLNNFKHINDAHGHAAGDSVLQHFASLLANPDSRHRRACPDWRRRVRLDPCSCHLDQAQKKAENLAQNLRDTRRNGKARPSRSIFPLVSVSCAPGRVPTMRSPRPTGHV
jgi:hypothetical protein